MRAGLFLFAVSLIWAQTREVSGGISGKVDDEFGTPVAGASVTAKDASGKEFKATATAKGEYAIEQLAAGTYEVRVTALAMKPFTKKDVAVAAGERAKLDASLTAVANLGTLGDGDRFSLASWTRGAKNPPSGPTPRLADGKPDLSGFWMDPTDLGDTTAPPPPQPNPFPWADQIRKERVASSGRDHPGARCLPGSILTRLSGTKLIHTPAYLLMLTSGEPARQIFLDGRSHPADPQPSWLGHSIGRWESSAQPGRGVVRGQEADTLVVDTVGFNGLAWWNGGLPATEQMHIVERYRRIDLGHLEVEVTVEDPPVLQTPWTKKSTLNLDTQEEYEEYVCDENNKDPQHMVGK